MTNFTKEELFQHQGSYEDFQFGTSRYFAQQAVDYYGNAVRDNSISELVSIGQELENE